MKAGEVMSKWPVAVVERFPDGSKSKHYFESQEDAQVAVDELSKPDRTYEIVATV